MSLTYRYNLHGFRAEYSGFDFLRWFKQFAEPYWDFYFPQDCEYHNLKKACVNYARENADKVYTHFARLERNQKMQMLKALSQELGVSVESNHKEDIESSLFQEEESGQLSLFA